ncbi:hypothetical protein [Ruegeria sp.]|uniref:hypothetical protein n=1 Tax=Ruegeria sp. TaxID=1879320 RepID=UPI0023170114|nr:hypothetical protein [Ruegeria sp.]MDA7964316.1 hypothetical protein [Ruegeria sp.]
MADGTTRLDGHRSSGTGKDHGREQFERAPEAKTVSMMLRQYCRIADWMDVHNREEK